MRLNEDVSGNPVAPRKAISLCAKESFYSSIATSTVCLPKAIFHCSDCPFGCFVRLRVKRGFAEVSDVVSLYEYGKFSASELRSVVRNYCT